ncbi:MAG: ferritin-like protein [Planctomycetaceae bacterium]|nr:ferritin-like protein [Planctomycetaceae bacterium]
MRTLDQRLDELCTQLQFAMMVEHSTIPPYLCALYSIREGSNEEAVSLIQSVVMEEMLHMVLVANLTNALGGTTCVSQPAFVPRYPNYLPNCSRNFMVHLRKFSRESVETFMEIEKPDAGDQPVIDNYYWSIGDFYAALREELVSLVRDHKETAVFRGYHQNPQFQVTGEHYYGGAGTLFPIRGLFEAQEAILQIVDQGEGFSKEKLHDEKFIVRPTSEFELVPLVPAFSQESRFLHKEFDGTVEPAHYFRFEELYVGRYYQKGDSVTEGPKGPVFPVDWSAVHNMQDNPHAGDYVEGSVVRQKLDEFNQCYTRLLLKLQRAFSGQPNAIMEGVAEMFEIKHRSQELMRIPNPLDDGATTVGPSFEFDCTATAASA